MNDVEWIFIFNMVNGTDLKGLPKTNDGEWMFVLNHFSTIGIRRMDVHETAGHRSRDVYG